MKTTKALLLALSACGIASAGPAQAADFSFTGNFTPDDDVQLFNFVVGAPSNVTLRAWSYAGGVNAAGATIARGGFDTILALFDGAGTFLGQNDDGGCGLVAADSLTGRCWDTFLTQSLTAGNYTVAIMQYDNFAVGGTLANGFTRSGQGNFTAGFGCPDAQRQFNDVSDVLNGCGRDSHWAFDILNVNDAVQQQTGGVPEPGTWALLLVGFGLAGASLRSRQRQPVRIRYS